MGGHEELGKFEFPLDPCGLKLSYNMAFMRSMRQIYKIATIYKNKKCIDPKSLFIR